ncbi:MAG: lysine transporter LysE [Kiloniella sp.]|nr:lysine transporter LysE [Kiloniella sp.]
MLESLATHPLIVGAVYSFIAAMTPGPNNLMLLSSGMTFGLRRTLPHMFGVAGGFLVLMTIVIIGVGALLAAMPAVRWALLLAGSTFMAYLAYRTMTASTDLERNKASRPLTFLEASAFQAINPKGWGYAISYTAMIAGLSETGEIGWMLGVGAVAVSLSPSAFSSMTWVSLGQLMSRLIDDPRRIRLINVCLGMSLFLMIPLMFLSELQDILGR